MCLSKLKEGQRGRIVNVALPEKFTKRLHELGIKKDAVISVSRKKEGAFIIISCYNSYYALRYKDCENIEICAYE